MISSYLYTIGKYLSSKQRDEILQEIEANLYDYLEENFGKKDYSNEEYEQAFRSMGPPKKVAEAYMNSPRCLIGPAYIDTYWLVLKITLIGMAIGLTLANLIALSNTDNIIQVLYSTLMSIWQAAMSTLGIVTLIFVIIQHNAPAEPENTDEDWSLDLLETAPERHQKISVSELIFESVFICFALVILNHPTPPVIISFTDKEMMPFINMAVFKPFLLWINITLGLNLLLNLYLLLKRRWQTFTRIFSILLDIAGVIIFAKLIMTPGWWNFPLLRDTLARENIELGNSLRISFRITLVIVIIIVGIDVIKHIRAMLLEK
jgi:hypothetical protein